MSKDMVRAWLTLQGLTGQATLTSDRLPDVPKDRISMLRQVIPPRTSAPWTCTRRGARRPCGT